MDFTPLRPGVRNDEQQAATQLLRQNQFARLMAFAGVTIDDVVSSPVAKRTLYNWFKTDRRLHRRLDVLALERQWNPLR